LTDAPVDFKRKENTAPQTSASVHIFSFINKADEFGIRLTPLKGLRELFIEEYECVMNLPRK